MANTLLNYTTKISQKRQTATSKLFTSYVDEMAWKEILNSAELSLANFA